MALEPHIKAVGFDMDGTFMNTRVDYPRLHNVVADVMKEENIPMGEHNWKQDERLTKVPIYGWIYDAGRWDDVEDIIKKINDRSTEIEKQYYLDASPFPLAVETMDALKHAGYKVGILTRGGRDYAESVLAIWSIYERFDAVVCRDDYPYCDAKPSPIGMRNLAKELGVKPEEILYLGDNLGDWYTARDSGAAFVGVLSGNCTLKDWKDAGVTDVVGGVGALLERI
mgnify:CR=1 FL=1